MNGQMRIPVPSVSRELTPAPRMQPHAQDATLINGPRAALRLSLSAPSVPEVSTGRPDPPRWPTYTNPIMEIHAQRTHRQLLTGLHTGLGSTELGNLYCGNRCSADTFAAAAPSTIAALVACDLHVTDVVTVSQ